MADALDKKGPLGCPHKNPCILGSCSNQGSPRSRYCTGEGGRSAYEDDSERQAQVHFEDQWIDAPFACHDNRSDSPIDLVEQGDIEIEQASHRSHYAGQPGPV